MASIKHSMFRDMNAMDMANPHVVASQDEDQKTDSSKKKTQAE